MYRSLIPVFASEQIAIASSVLNAELAIFFRLYLQPNSTAHESKNASFLPNLMSSFNAFSGLPFVVLMSWRI